MATTVRELRDWLKPFYDDDRIAIDEGGLTLEMVEEHDDVVDSSFEIGGWPLDEDEESEMRQAEGSEKDRRWKVSPWHGESGSVFYVVNACLDGAAVSYRTRAEAEEHAQALNLQQLMLKS